MSMWAGIKYAINSTLGTSDFKPLDKMYKDSLVLVGDRNAITSKKNFGTSTRFGDVATIGNYSGIVNVYVYTAWTSTGRRRGLFSIYKNGVRVYDSPIVLVSSSTDEQGAIISDYIPISVSPGDQISFYAPTYYNASGNTDTNAVSKFWYLCGSLGHNGNLAE